jgi:hypothetical protein
LRCVLLLLLAAVVLAAAAPRADARIPRAFVCWEPDNEFPVECDDDDD